MTPHEIETTLAALQSWPGELTRTIRAVVKTHRPDLSEIYKWNSVMWCRQGVLVAGVVPLNSAVKVCLFSLPPVGGMPTQKWSATIASQNLIYASPEAFSDHELLTLLRPLSAAELGGRTAR